MKKMMSLLTAAAVAGTALIPAAPAAAQGYYGNRGQQVERGYYRDRDYRYDRSARAYRNNRQNRYYRRCDNGDGGTIIGAIAGGLLGNSVAGRGDRTLGTVLGAGVGALAGRSIDRAEDGGRRRC